MEKEILRELLKANIKAALLGDAELKIKKKGNEADVTVKGDPISILVALASLENKILEDLHCPETVFEFAKKLVGEKEA